MTLRPYQEKIVLGIRSALRKGHRRILVSSPTGSGKTAIFLHLAAAAAAKGNRTAVLVERIALADQTAEAAERAGLDCGIVQADRGDRGADMDCYSQQTIEARSDTAIWPDERLVIIDECHVSRRMITEWIRSDDRQRDNPNQVILGFTATPMTPGLGVTYETMVQGPTTAELQADGWLLDVTDGIYTAPADVLMQMEQYEPAQTGEWKGEDVDEETAKIVGRIPEEWERICQQHFESLPKTLVFSSTVSSGRKITDAFNARFPAGSGGIAAQVSYKDSRQRRAEILRRFKASGGPDELHVLVNVAIVGRGFDCPEASVLVDCNPYRSNLMGYAQMVGRILRPANKRAEPGERAIVIDHAANYHRFLPGWAKFRREGVAALLPDPAPDEERTAWVCPGGREHDCGTLNLLAKGRICRGCGSDLDAILEDAGHPDAPVQHVGVWICEACGEPNRLGSVECVACRKPRPKTGGNEKTEGWKCDICGGLNELTEYRCAHDNGGSRCTGEKPEKVQEVDARLEKVEMDEPAGRDESVDLRAPDGKHYAWCHLSEMALRNKLKRRKNVTAKVRDAAQRYAKALYHELFGVYPAFGPHMAREVDVDERIEGWVKQHEADYAAQMANQYGGRGGGRYRGR